ncbi:MAG: GNAT family N-acetyltransferase [Fusobacteriota bacterium]
MLKVYEANPESKKDVQAIKSIESEAFGEGGIDEWVILPIIRCGKVYLLKKDDETIGIAEIIKKWEKNAIYIYSIALKLNFCGKGYGTFFLDEILKRLKSENIKKVYLTVSPDNIRAIKLYEKFGFKKGKFLKDEYGPGKDRIYMKKILK